jgi:predicted membrane protein
VGKGRALAGIIIVLIGVVFMLNTLGIADIQLGSLFADYFWPVVLILMGLTFLTGSRHVSGSRLVISIVLIGLGLVMIGNHLGLFHVYTDNLWGLFWPVILILIGVNLLSRNRGSNNWAVMGTVNRRQNMWDLKTEDYWAVMGSVHVDLRTANIPDGETVLHATAVMGEVTVFVPEGLAVVCRGNCVMGGLNFFGREQGGFVTTHEFEHGDVHNSPKVVKLQCESIMGNVKIIQR